MKKIFYTLLFYTFFLGKSVALIEIDITRGNLDPLPIAVSPLHVDVKSDNFKDIQVKELGNNIANIIETNLRQLDYSIHLKKRLLFKNLT